MNMKILILLFALIFGGAVVYYFVTKEPPLQITNFEECAAAGYPVMESYPRQCKTPSGQTFAEDIGNELEKANLIRVFTPRPNQTIYSPLVVQGEARGTWFFEASFPVRLFDGNGKEIALGIAQAQDEWMTESFVPFKTKLIFENPETATGTLVLEKDNPSGLPENADELRVPIRFDLSQNTMGVQVFFSSNQLDPEVSCNKVFVVQRTIAKTQAVARAALEELLKGTNESEKARGFFTSLNSGVQVQELTIENKVARVDFNEQLEFQVGGSCRVSAIRAQITETLKQFPTVNSVIISVNGRTEDILQP
ncbi:MAG: GerMN domain-containing protein [bacterium]|nr:GerMN domain-containing protein [bacterium]